MVVVMVAAAPAGVEPGEDVVDVWAGVARRDAARAAVQSLAPELVVHLALALCNMIG